MTVEEIKQSTSMNDVLSRYGLGQPNRKGFMLCPFHKEKNSSFKLKSNHLFVMVAENVEIYLNLFNLMENCSFKDAYLSLGGEYEQKQDTFAYQQKRKELELKWKMEKAEKEFRKELEEFIPKEMMFYRKECKKYSVFSDTWCFCKKLQCDLEILFDEKIFPKK